MDLIDELVLDPINAFIKNSRMMVYRCEKPNYTEFTRSVFATLIGFVIMGFLGFFVKVIFIPINNVILGA